MISTPVDVGSVASAASSTTVAFNIGVAVPAGVTAFAAAYGSAAGLTAASMSDSVGNTWVRVGEIYTSPNQLTIFASQINLAMATSTTLTATFSAAAINKGLAVLYVGGWVQTTVQSFQTGSTASGTAITTAGINPTSAYTFCFGAHWHGNTNTVTPDFTEMHDIALTSGRLETQYAIRTSVFSDGMNSLWTTAAAGIVCGGCFPVRDVDSDVGPMSPRTYPMMNAAQRASRY